jgi:hypothetical protein
MKKTKLLIVGAEIGLVATVVLLIAFQDLWNTFIGVACVSAALALVGWLIAATQQAATGDRALGVGTVRTVTGGESPTAAGERQVFVEVVAVSGETFVGKLAQGSDHRDVSMLRPGLVILVAFDPAAREELSLPTDVLAVRARRALASLPQRAPSTANVTSAAQ